MQKREPNPKTIFAYRYFFCKNNCRRIFFYDNYYKKMLFSYKDYTNKQTKISLKNIYL